MNDLIKLHEQAKEVLFNAHVQFKKREMMLNELVPEHQIQAVRTKYFELMNKYTDLINEIQKLSYGKYI
tara:strand:+ start:698 stop:904 length:207 start_codon:yes stop_codon:yes gene_type:complete